MRILDTEPSSAILGRVMNPHQLSLVLLISYFYHKNDFFDLKKLESFTCLLNNLSDITLCDVMFTLLYVMCIVLSFQYFTIDRGDMQGKIEVPRDVRNSKGL